MKFRNAADAKISSFWNAKGKRRVITYARRLPAVEEFAVRYKMSGHELYGSSDFKAKFR
jgi:hypothetical protein